MTGGIWPHARLFATLAGLLGLTVCVQAQVPAKACLLSKVTDLPLDETAGWFSTTVRINDHPVVMLIDTGASHSTISAEVAKQLHLPEDRRNKITVHGIGGDMKAAHPVIAHSFQAGAGHLVDYELSVTYFAKGRPGMPEGLLGLDLLSDYELEFDYPNRILTLYTAENCSGNFVPWTGHFDAIQGKRQLDGRLFIPVRLNKEAINAVIDTGAHSSAIGIDTAHDIGVPDEVLRLDRSTNSFGAPGVPVRAYAHRFDSFTIGEATFQRVPLFVQDQRFGVEQMLLGMDFFRRRKLWLSFKTEQIFVQPAPPAHEQAAPQ
jgi:clan AA aspartic protease (TIGR02281 family)